MEILLGSTLELGGEVMSAVPVRSSPFAPLSLVKWHDFPIRIHALPFDFETHPHISIVHVPTTDLP